jgi:hypothetical protein
MALYLSALDTRFQYVAQRLMTKLEMGVGGEEGLVELNREDRILSLLLETTSRQLALARVAMQGSMGKELAPDPAALVLETIPETHEEFGGGLWDLEGGDAELISDIAGVTPVLRSAIGFVLGVGDVRDLPASEVYEVLDEIDKKPAKARDMRKVVDEKDSADTFVGLTPEDML